MERNVRDKRSDPADLQTVPTPLTSKPFLKEGAFHFQQVQSITVAHLVRRLGRLSDEEWGRVLGTLAERLSL